MGGRFRIGRGLCPVRGAGSVPTPRTAGLLQAVPAVRVPGVPEPGVGSGVRLGAGPIDVDCATVAKLALADPGVGIALVQDFGFASLARILHLAGPLHGHAALFAGGLGRRSG